MVIPRFDWNVPQDRMEAENLKMRVKSDPLFSFEKENARNWLKTHGYWRE